MPFGHLTARAARSHAVLAAAAALALSAVPTFAAVRDAGPAPRDPAADVSPFFLTSQDSRPADTGPSVTTGPAATGPAGAAAVDPKTGELKVVVREVTGSVTVSTDDGKTWKRVAAGDGVGTGAVFRTGLRSGVTCTVGTDQMFTLESLSTIRVDEAVRTGGVEKTDLVMKYGAASYGIERAGREYDAVIRTPGSTMAIRGTVVRLYDRAGFAPQAESYTGRALFRTAKGSTFVGGRGYSVASAAQGSAAETALSNATIDPSIAAARTASESRLVAEQLSQGGVLGFDARANIPVVRGTGPLPDSALPGALPGQLSFALRWSGPADLNFIVDNQAGDSTNIVLNGFQPTEILYPGFGLNTSASGGLIPFDNRGGKKGGTEIAYWKGSYPTGVYGVGILHASGGTTDFKVNAFLNGQPLPIFTFDAEGNVVKTNTLTGTVGKGESDGAILFVPRNSLFEGIATDAADPVTQQAAARAMAAIQQQASAKKSSPSPAGSKQALALAGPTTAQPTADVASAQKATKAKPAAAVKTNSRGGRG